MTTRHVVIVVYWTRLGGAERHALNLARFLAGERGWTVTLTAIHDNGPLFEMARQDGIQCVCLGDPGWSSIGLLRFAWKLRRLKPDLLYPCLYSCHLFVGLIWRLTGAASCVWGIRSSGDEFNPSKTYLLATCLTPWFVANSLDGAENFLRRFHVERDQMRIIFNAVRPDNAKKSPQDWRRDLNVSEETLLVSMPANLQPLKDHQLLIQAWASVVKSFPGAHLVLAGDKRDSWPDVEQLIEDLALTGQVTATGYVDDISGLLKTSDVVVLTSSSEGCPNAVLEAMHLSKAVVATAPQTRWFLTQEQHAPGKDSRQLAKKLLVLLKDDLLRRRLGDRNRRLAERYFDYEINSLRHLNAFEHILEGRTPPQIPLHPELRSGKDR